MEYLPSHLARIVRAVGRLHYLTNRQLLTLFEYSPKSATHVEELTHELTERGYLLKLQRELYGRGSPPQVHVLSQRGWNWLAEQELVAGRYRESEKIEQSGNSGALPHTLDVNDVLIAFERMHRRQDRVKLAGYFHERDIRRIRLPAYPDAWIELEVWEGDETPAHDVYLLELDRGSEDDVKIQDKVSRLVNFIGGRSYIEAFGSDLFRAVLWVAPDERRLDELGRLTQLELERQRLPHYDQIFRYATKETITDPAWLAGHL